MKTNLVLALMFCSSLVCAAQQQSQQQTTQPPTSTTTPNTVNGTPEEDPFSDAARALGLPASTQETFPTNKKPVPLPDTKTIVLPVDAAQPTTPNTPATAPATAPANPPSKPSQVTPLPKPSPIDEPSGLVPQGTLEAAPTPTAPQVTISPEAMKPAPEPVAPETTPAATATRDEPAGAIPAAAAPTTAPASPAAPSVPAETAVKSTEAPAAVPSSAPQPASTPAVGGDDSQMTVPASTQATGAVDAPRTGVSRPAEETPAVNEPGALGLPDAPSAVKAAQANQKPAGSPQPADDTQPGGEASPATQAAAGATTSAQAPAAAGTPGSASEPATVSLLTGSFVPAAANACSNVPLPRCDTGIVAAAVKLGPVGPRDRRHDLKREKIGIDHLYVEPLSRWSLIAGINVIHTNPAPGLCNCFNLFGGMIGLDRMIKPHWDLAFRGDFAEKNGATTGQNLAISTAQVGIKYDIRPNRHDSYFVEALGGVVKPMSNFVANNDLAASAMVGAGVDFAVKTHWDIRVVEASMDLTTEPNGQADSYQYNVKIYTGVKYKFGR